MANARDEILDWVEQGRIAPERLRAALEAAGALPTADEWRAFLDRMLLFMGAVLLGAGAIFFLAFNWHELGRFAKFGLVQAPILAALAAVWALGLERAAGKAVLLAAALLVGALLALIGQTYQTGADTFELFAAWALAILPWALVARFPALWVLWLALANVALSLYFHTLGVLWGMLFAPEKLLWLLFALNTTALALWEGLAAAGVAWLRGRWSARLIATAGGVVVTWLAVLYVVDSRSAIGWGVPVWLAWLAALYYAYRVWRADLYMLAGGVLSVIVLAAVFLARHMIRADAAAAYLFIGLVVIGLSAAGGWWLRQVANEEK
jgi:uncharacterized membrane protein